jgi:hypothetical protein
MLCVLQIFPEAFKTIKNEKYKVYQKQKRMNHEENKMKKH